MNFPRREEATNKELILTIIEIQGYLARYGKSHTNWHETLNEVIERLEWIPVSERYPKIEDECKYFLITDDKGKVSVQKFLLSLEEEPQPYFSGMVNVIAWMPLPEPYKAESEIEDYE